MDTTKEYIKMCKKAEEIQKHTYNFGDWFGAFMEVEELGKPWTGPLRLAGVITDLDSLPKNVVWLPRQDQLQEMVFGQGQLLEGVGACGQAQYLLDFVNSLDLMVAASMEQLWQGFVMNEKYNKVWKDNQWIVKSAL